VVYVKNTGLRVASPEITEKIARGERVPSSQYYFRGLPEFEAPKGPYDWMNNYLFLCTGQRLPSSVLIHVWKIL
jgi:hypothetical protein